MNTWIAVRHGRMNRQAEQTVIVPPTVKTTMNTLVNVVFGAMLSVIAASGCALAQSSAEAQLAQENIILRSGRAPVGIYPDLQVGKLPGNTAGLHWGSKAALTGSVTIPIAELAFFVALGAGVRPPIGWVHFCTEHVSECDVKPLEARDVVLTTKAWKVLQRINKWVNDFVKPLTDLDHWGVFERWSYPDDGYGDCEDYVLLKRKMLMQAGWPRQALLITVVHDQEGKGHAVLTVKTDKGEFILDNDGDSIMLWSETRYRYVKRQSQADPNVWIALGDALPILSTAASR